MWKKISRDSQQDNIGKILHGNIRFITDNTVYIYSEGLAYSRMTSTQRTHRKIITSLKKPHENVLYIIKLLGQQNNLKHQIEILWKTLLKKRFKNVLIKNVT